jgi:hypothetical protein
MVGCFLNFKYLALVDTPVGLSPRELENVFGVFVHLIIRISGVRYLVLVWFLCLNNILHTLKKGHSVLNLIHHIMGLLGV